MLDLFGETVYEQADSAPPHHFHINLAAAVDLCTHYLFTLTITTPLTLLGIYELLVYRPLWASQSWLLDDLALLGLLALIILLLACIAQLAYHSTHSQHLPYNRWKPWGEELAVVTGGASGVGLCLAKQLAAKGCRVAVLDVSPAPADVQLHELYVNTGKVRFYKCDISDPEAVRSSVERLQQDFSGDPITILVNNAGVVSARQLEELTERDIRRTFNVNCLAHFWTVQSILPIMKRHRYGHLITISSTMGLTAVAGMTDYCASKYAVTGFHEALRQEIRNYPFPHLIHTTMICPGLILTGMFGGIRIRFPFLVPPLKAQHVVDRIMQSLDCCVCLPWTVQTTRQSLEQCLERHQPSAMDRWRQHKVVWMPTSYYLLPLLNICCPVWLYDYLKQLFGGNSALTETFRGRSSTKE